MKIFGTLLLLPFVMILGIGLYLDIQFDKNCGNYLKMAGDATNVEIARVRLGKALEYLEGNNMTKGNTGVFITYPSNDLEIWYSNLKSAHNNLSIFPANSTESDVANTLVKLRETLMDHDEESDKLTLPAHIHLFPNQTFYIYGEIFALILGLLGIVIIIGSSIK